MNSLSEVLDWLRSFDVERALGLRPSWPRVAVELEPRQLSAVRLKAKRRGTPLLEGQDVRELSEPGVPPTMFDQTVKPGQELADRVRESLEALGVRPGRVSLLLPDNLAKISLVTLPERPSSYKQLLEIIRFKMHRALPFRFSEATLTFQLLPGEGQGLSLLVALMRRALVERYEQVMEAVGTRPGLIDVCTPSLFNLCRERIDAAGSDGDVALLNCTGSYFSLVVVRKGKIIFFRCKSYTLGEQHSAAGNGMLTREVANSFSYYEEKLGGEGIGTMLVRSVTAPFEELSRNLAELGVQRVELVDPLSAVKLAEGTSVDPDTGQRIAPAVGAVVGRG
jgi:Tfp pilus assembly PilM family ATPase